MTTLGAAGTRAHQMQDRRHGGFPIRRLAGSRNSKKEACGGDSAEAVSPTSCRHRPCLSQERASLCRSWPPGAAGHPVSASTSTSVRPSWRSPSRTTRFSVSKEIPASPPSARIVISTLTSELDAPNGRTATFTTSRALLPGMALTRTVTLDSTLGVPPPSSIGGRGSPTRPSDAAAVRRPSSGAIVVAAPLDLALGSRSSVPRSASSARIVAARTRNVPGWNWISLGSSVDPMVMLDPGQLPTHFTDRITKHDSLYRWHQARKQSSIHHPSSGFASDHAPSLCSSTFDGRGQNPLTIESGRGSYAYRLASGRGGPCTTFRVAG